MILTGSEIERRVADGSITLEPFSSDLLNPNSYNYRLGSEILMSSSDTLDVAKSEPDEWTKHRIPDAGFVLRPKTLYLGHTVETIGSLEYVPLLIGRSSIGRLGLFLQISADLGQLGSIHRWTLELVAVQPIRVYPGMRIGQVSFWKPTGQIMEYNGFFGTMSEPTATPGGYALNDPDRARN
ncbi:deoxycytidine deaminase [Rathayibacter sp. VKM Ac-2804]|nr:deoxycytidine deaminase [Rathayibacter sp. VKM Ac-2804]